MKNQDEFAPINVYIPFDHFQSLFYCTLPDDHEPYLRNAKKKKS